MQDMAQLQNVRPIPLSFETKLKTIAPATVANPVLSGVLLVACSLAYFFSAIVISRKTGLWMDEVMASWMTQLPSAKMIWQAISHGTISSPPTYFYLLKVVTAIFGPSYLALRMPSILAIYLTGIVAFLIMRRRFPAPIAVLGMALCFVTGLFGYATQVREYALVTACSAVAAFLWYPPRGQMLAPWRIALMTVCLGVGIALHFYAVLLVVAFGLMELLWAVVNRRIRFGVWAGIFIAGASVFAWLPLMRQIMKYTGAYASSTDYYAKPTIYHLLSAYADLALGIKGVTLLCGFIAILAAASYWAKLKDSGSSMVREDESMPRSASQNANLEIIILGTITVPLIVYVFAAAITHTFNERYAIVASFGFAMLLARLVSYLRYRNVVSYALIAAAIVLLAHAPRRLLAEDQDFYATQYLATSGDVPIVVGEGLAYFELQGRAAPALAKRLVYLSTPPGETSPDICNEDLLNRWRQFHPGINVQNPVAFLRDNPHFYVLHSSQSTDVITPWLMHLGLLRAKWNKVNKRDTRDLWLFEVQAQNNPPPAR